LELKSNINKCHRLAP